MREKLEELQIYKQYVEMLYYTNNIIKKYPKCERFDLVNQIKNTSYQGLICVLKTYKAYDKKEKLDNLSDLDMNLKVLKVLIRISYRNKYINSKNYVAWSRKIANLIALMSGWIKWVKQ